MKPYDLGSAELRTMQAEMNGASKAPSIDRCVEDRRSMSLSDLDLALSVARKQFEDVKAEVQEANRIQAEREQKAYQSVEKIQRQIIDTKKAEVEPVVSEHALLRWLERVMRIDMNEVTKRILDESTKSKIMFAGSGKIYKDGVCIVFKNKTVVTVSVKDK